MQCTAASCRSVNMNLYQIHMFIPVFKLWEKIEDWLFV